MNPKIRILLKRDIGKLSVFTSGILVFIFALYFHSYFDALAKIREAQKNGTKPKIVGFYRPLDGKKVDEKNYKSEVHAVVIDNGDEALPIKGLSYAGVVYEFPVEGEFTRLLAIFPDDAPYHEVGPVRSLRPYFLDVVKEYGGLVIHAGGSPEAMDKVKKFRSLNEISSLGRYFYRDRERKAPHNLFTNTDKINDALEFLGDSPENFRSWLFKDDPPFHLRKKDVKVVAAGEEQFVYNTDTNSYEWRRGENTRKDGSNNKKVKIKNIIVMKTQKPVVLDEEGRLGLKLLGRGEAKIYRDGAVVNGFWRKDKPGDRIRWVDKEGGEIVLRRGLTWVYVSS